MKEERLTSEELSRALLDYYLIGDENTYLINNIYNDSIILNKEINNIYKEYIYKENKNYKISNVNDYVYENSSRRKQDLKKEEEKPISSAELERIQSFLNDESQILDGNSPTFLIENLDVALSSIRRDIKSIVFVGILTEQVKTFAIEQAKRQNYVFKVNTPSFMLYNTDLIKQSILNDINTIDLVPEKAWTIETSNYAYQQALKNNYILNTKSPLFLRKGFDICKQSIKLKPQSANLIEWSQLSEQEKSMLINEILISPLDFVITSRTHNILSRNINICIKSIKCNPKSIEEIKWNYFNNEERELLVNTLIEINYVLSITTPHYLTNNVTICLNSIKNDVNSGRYIPTSMIEEHPEILKQLIINGYYSLEGFLKFGTDKLKDNDILDYYLKQMGIPKGIDEKSNLYFARVKKFIKDVLNKPLEIKNLKKVFHFIALKEWEKYRQENYDYYTNIFNRICDSLEKNNNFISALNELKFLIEVDDVLEERKYLLFNAFIEYHQIYHNPNIKNKLELLQDKKDDISKNAALFISKSKEDFISDKISEFDEVFKRFFIIRIDNPLVKKKVVEIKQREMIKKMYKERDLELLSKLGLIKQKYLTYEYHSSIKKENINGILELFITKIIDGNICNVDDILSDIKPNRFDDYEIYEKVSKLINRLNNHNISYDGSEIEKYRNLISFNGSKYYYNGLPFDDSELSLIMGYKDLKYVFGKVKSEIMQLTKSIGDFTELTKEDIESLVKECPFTDEFYSFDSKHLNRWHISIFNDFLKIFEDSKKNIIENDNYEILYSLFVENGLLPFAMISEIGAYDKKGQVFDKIIDYVTVRECANTSEVLPKLTSLLSKDEFNIEYLDKILDFKEMFKYADIKQISLLGKKTIKKIYSNNGFTSSSQKERINVACDLVSAMTSRSVSTVPYISGNVHNYRYSMYDSTDETLLTVGLDTNACFRCCGNDNDFLHYCALDKNGFVIKITDLEGNFIGRASGFRNGNGVYINQLRTIYDKKSSAYSSEREAIIKTFEKACNDIVEESQNNPNEQTKIDFVVVTKSYTLDNTTSNVDSETTDKIGINPMDTESEDWIQFKHTTKNLREAAKHDFFNTDFGNYSLICMKSAIGELTPEKIKKGDIPAVYKRTRKQISVNEASELVEQNINKIRAIQSNQNGTEFTFVKIPQQCKVIIGDNWYIIFGQHGILDSCCLPHDEFAKQEYKSVTAQLIGEYKNTEYDTQIPKPKR